MPWDPNWKGYFYSKETHGDDIVDMDPNALAEKCIGESSEHRSHGLFLLAGGIFDLAWCGGPEMWKKAAHIAEAAERVWPEKGGALSHILLIVKTAQLIARENPNDGSLSAHAQEGAAKVVQGLFPPD